MEDNVFKQLYECEEIEILKEKEIVEVKSGRKNIFETVRNVEGVKDLKNSYQKVKKTEVQEQSLMDEESIDTEKLL